MAKKCTSSDLSILSLNEATARGLMPLTVAEACNTPLRVGHDRRSVRYIDWLATEQQRITQDGDRQAEIVDEGEGRVSLWVNSVVSC